MNSLEIRDSLLAMIPAELDRKYPFPVYKDIITAILNYYFFTDNRYDCEEAIATFDRFLKTDVLKMGK